MSWQVYRSRKSNGIIDAIPIEKVKTASGKDVVVKRLTYSQKYMGEESVTATIECESPVEFQIGDYIMYRGVPYSIQALPSVKKIARRNSVGNAFTYDSVKFCAPSDELTRCMFLDYVHESQNVNNELFYSKTSEFNFYASDVMALAWRIQANLDRVYGKGKWKIVQSESLASNPGKQNIVVTASKNTCWDALLKVQSDFDLNFSIHGRTITIGEVEENIDDAVEQIKGEAAGSDLGKSVEYGKGNGIKTLERTADENQLVVTRLRAYGNTTNLPLRYYQNLNYEYFLPGKKTKKDGSVGTEGSNPYGTYKREDGYTAGSHDVFKHYITIDNVWTQDMDDFLKENIGASEVKTMLVYHKSYAPKHFSNFNEDNGTGEFFIAFNGVEMKVPVVCRRYTIEEDATHSIGSPSGGEHGSNNGSGNSGTGGIGGGGEDNETSKDYPTTRAGEATDGDSSRQYKKETNYVTLMFVDKSVADAMEADGARITIVRGQSRNSWPCKKMNVPEATNAEFESINVKNLMLPGFPTKALNSVAGLTGCGCTLSDDPRDPYIDSYNIEELGIREAVVYFDNDELGDIYPSIENYGDDDSARPEIISTSGYQDSNGMYGLDGKEENVPSFKIVVKLDFNPWDYREDGQTPTIAMKDGGCGGREFEITRCKDLKNGTYELTCKRVEDMDLYFPYGPANGGHAINPGDKFVLLNISLPDKYVEAAARKLLEEADKYLHDNCQMVYKYSIELDAVFVARQKDIADAGKSIYDTICAGMRLRFVDIDIASTDNHYVSVIIDSLEISEGEGLLPRISLTLDDDPQGSQLTRTQQKLEHVEATALTELYSLNFVSNGAYVGSYNPASKAMTVDITGSGEWTTRGGSSSGESPWKVVENGTRQKPMYQNPSTGVYTTDKTGYAVNESGNTITVENVPVYIANDGEYTTEVTDTRATMEATAYAVMLSEEYDGAYTMGWLSALGKEDGLGAGGAGFDLINRWDALKEADDEYRAASAAGANLLYDLYNVVEELKENSGGGGEGGSGIADLSGYTWWGQSAIEKRVSGDMTGVGNIAMDGAITITNGGHSATISLDEEGHLRFSAGVYSEEFVSALGKSEGGGGAGGAGFELIQRWEQLEEMDSGEWNQYGVGAGLLYALYNDSKEFVRASDLGGLDFMHKGDPIRWSQLPKIYWANIEVSDRALDETAPTFGSVRIGDVMLEDDGEGHLRVSKLGDPNGGGIWTDGFISALGKNGEGASEGLDVRVDILSDEGEPIAEIWVGEAKYTIKAGKGSLDEAAVRSIVAGYGYLVRSDLDGYAKLGDLDGYLTKEEYVDEEGMLLSSKMPKMWWADQEVTFGERGKTDAEPTFGKITIGNVTLEDDGHGHLKVAKLGSLGEGGLWVDGFVSALGKNDEGEDAGLLNLAPYDDFSADGWTSSLAANAARVYDEVMALKGEIANIGSGAGLEARFSAIESRLSEIDSENFTKSVPYGEGGSGGGGSEEGTGGAITGDWSSLYWADQRLSDRANSNTSPRFGSIRIGDAVIEYDPTSKVLMVRRYDDPNKIGGSLAIGLCTTGGLTALKTN